MKLDTSEKLTIYSPPRPPARDALESMCHTSERDWHGTTYTIADIRYPAYNGKRIRYRLLNGEAVFYWID